MRILSKCSPSSVTTKSLFYRNFQNAYFQQIPLHYAAKNRNTEIVKILSKNKAVVNVRDNWQVKNH